MDLDNRSICCMRFSRAASGEAPVGRPILGRGNGAQIQQGFVGKRFGCWFAPDRFVLTAAGNVPHEKRLELVEREFGDLKPGGKMRSTLRVDRGAHSSETNAISSRCTCAWACRLIRLRTRAVCRGGENNLLGGGMSSRLSRIFGKRLGLA